MNTYNPVISRKEYKNGLFPRIPVLIANRAIILSSTASKRFHVIDSDHIIAINDIRREKYDEVIEIDLLDKRVRITSKAICSDKYYEFDVQLTIQAAVTDTVTYFQSNMPDIVPLVVDSIESQLQVIADGYDIKDYIEFSKELTNKLLSEKHSDFGITWEVISIQVRPDMRVREQFGEVSKVNYSKDVEKAKINAKQDITMLIIDGSKELGNRIGNDDGAAAYSALLSGDRSLADAFWNKLDKNNIMNDIKVEQFKKAIEIIALMKEKDLISDLEANERISKILGSISNSTLAAVNAGNNSVPALSEQSNGAAPGLIEDGSKTP